MLHFPPYLLEMKANFNAEVKEQGIETQKLSIEELDRKILELTKEQENRGLVREG